jgi:polysaccharide export outer membrane protein
MHSIIRLVLASSSLLSSSLLSQTPANASGSPGAPVSSYSLRPGDIVRLRIWREPDLSGDFPVDEFGRVNLPLVGTYVVVNENRESLSQKLVAAYKASVQNLSMDVIILRRIPVVGAVRTPGLYPVEATMTVADALAMAGGSTLEADQTSIALMRSGKVVIKEIDPALPVGKLATNPGDQLYVPPRTGYFERNPWALSALIQSTVTIAVAILTISTRH